MEHIQPLPSTFNPRELIMSVLMTPDMANFSGNVHGGELLKETRINRTNFNL